MTLFCVSQVERKSECLWFTDVTNRNAGEYSCTAKNEYGNGTYTFQISVRGNRNSF